jgi:hypothetical protein
MVVPLFFLTGLRHFWIAKKTQTYIWQAFHFELGVFLI